MKHLFFVLFLFSCNSDGGGSGAGSLGPLHPFEFIPDEADDWGEMMAEQYEDSLNNAKEYIKDSLEEEAADQRWIDSIAEEHHKRKVINSSKNLLKK